MPEPLNLLIPLDFLPESESALEYAVAVGKSLNARLHLLHILEEESTLYRIVISDKQREMIRLGASEKLDELAEKHLVPAKLSFTRTVLKGKVYDRIIEAARKTAAHIIIMGRTDSSDMKKNIAGTNTMHIIKQAQVPVITETPGLLPHHPSSGPDQTDHNQSLECHYHGKDAECQDNRHFIPSG